MNEVLTRIQVREGDLTTERWQDCEDIIERNKQLKNEPQKSDWGRHIASIPCIFLEKWLNEEFADTGHLIKLWGPEMDEIIKRKLRDPDYAFLRTDK